MASGDGPRVGSTSAADHLVRMSSSPRLVVSEAAVGTEGETAERSSQSLLPVAPARLDLELRQVTFEALRPVSGGVAITFVLFVIFNCLDLPPNAVGPVVAHDIALVLFCSVLWWITLPCP